MVVAVGVHGQMMAREEANGARWEAGEMRAKSPTPCKTQNSVGHGGVGLWQRRCDGFSGPDIAVVMVWGMSQGVVSGREISVAIMAETYRSRACR